MPTEPPVARIPQIVARAAIDAAAKVADDPEAALEHLRAGWRNVVEHADEYLDPENEEDVADVQSAKATLREASWRYKDKLREKRRRESIDMYDRVFVSYANTHRETERFHADIESQAASYEASPDQWKAARRAREVRESRVTKSQEPSDIKSDH